MSRGFFLITIVSSLILLNLKFMTNKIVPKNLSSDTRKDFKKSRLDILTEENDSLLKTLKRPGGSYKTA
mgnify:CR=1 FL=1